MLTQDLGITMPKIATGDGGEQQPPRQTLTGFSFEENEPEQHTHASTSTCEHVDGAEPNLAEMSTEELTEFINKCISSLHLYDWSPETGWTLCQKEARS
jgi:hypothetical protein